MAAIELYRGDSIPDGIRDLGDAISANNFVKHYLTEGLVSRSFLKANYADLSHKLEYLVAAHIGHKKGTEEETLYNRSMFLSLSESEETSERFMTHNRGFALKPVTYDKAKYVMWKFTPTGLKEVAPGLYHYEYKSDPIHIEKFFNEIVRSKSTMTMGDLAIHAVIQAHKHSPTLHQAMFVDAAKYLELRRAKGEIYRDALSNAQRDKEWLLLPTDPMNVGQGCTGRFVINAEIEIVKCLDEV